MITNYWEIEETYRKPEHNEGYWDLLTIRTCVLGQYQQLYEQTEFCVEWLVICMSQLLVNKFIVLKVEKYTKENSNTFDVFICLLYTHSIALSKCSK